MGKTVSAEYLSSMRAQFPDLDADAAAAWIATLQDVDNPETMLASVLAKGKFVKGRTSGPQSLDQRTRGTLAPDGGWLRGRDDVSHAEGIATAHARHCAHWCPTPAVAQEYLAGTPEAEWYASTAHLWAMLETPQGWHSAPCSNTAQVWIKSACEAALVRTSGQSATSGHADNSPTTVAGLPVYIHGSNDSAPTQQAEARLLRDWTQARN